MSEEKKYKLLKTIANPNGCYGVGEVITLDESVAQKYIDAGLVEEYKGNIKPRCEFDYEKAVGSPFPEEASPENDPENNENDDDDESGDEELDGNDENNEEDE